MHPDERDESDYYDAPDLIRLRKWGWIVFYVLCVAAMIWVVLR